MAFHQRTPYSLRHILIMKYLRLIDTGFSLTVIMNQVYSAAIFNKLKFPMELRCIIPSYNDMKKEKIQFKSYL